MKTIKLLLTESIDNLGIIGDVVTVKPGYARNFLLPRGYATEPTERNVKRLAQRRKQVEQEMQQLRLNQEQLLAKLEGLEVTIQRSANDQGVLFGGVSQHDIAEALQAEGHNIDDRSIRIGEQIKRLDSYTIPIVLANDLRTDIKLWVVSDRPRDELDGSEDQAEDVESTEPPEQVQAEPEAETTSEPA